MVALIRSLLPDGKTLLKPETIAQMKPGVRLIEPGLECLVEGELHALVFGFAAEGEAELELRREPRLVDDVRDWRATEPDWRATRLRIVERYGYDRFGGNVHVVPNHALVHLGLLYGNDDFQRALMIIPVPAPSAGTSPKTPEVYGVAAEVPEWLVVPSTVLMPAAGPAAAAAARTRLPPPRRGRFV